MNTTTLSSKGQVILPKSIRDANRLRSGMRFSVEDTPEGILLRAQQPFVRTRFAEVRGSLRYTGKPKTIEQMNAGLLAEARRRHARG